MYLILDSAVRKSLIERAKVKESFNTSLLEHEEEKEEKNIFNNYKMVVNPTLDILFQQSENTIYMYSRPGKTNINDIFTFLTVNEGVPQNVKCKKTKIIGFTYEIKKINYVFVCDPNDVHQITFKEIQVLCEKNNVPFKNQTFTQLIKQIRTKYFDELKGRIKFSKEFKQLVLDKSKNKCACCNCKLDKFHIDHIIPLANDGTNELSNLQALCIGCHMDKTANEQENGQYVKFTDTESSFNEKVQEIMNGVLSSSYAFVEQLEKTHMDEKIFTIDINKCRRNILLNHKYDYCVFNVMDDPKEFNINMEIREGLYYIESDNFFPLRGNGWYYHSLVAHCLDKNIITRSDIKYVIYASSTLKHDHYNGFIEYCNKNILSYQEIQQHYNEKDEEYQDEDGETIDEDFLNLACLKKRATLTDYKKSCINSMIGAFKPNLVKHSQWSSTIITSCKLEALRNAIEKDESFIDTFWDDDDNIFYHVLSPHKVSNVETERPLYDQIVQQEIIELHKLKMLVESKGGRITDLNTDAITCTFPDDQCPFNLIDDKNINGYYWDDEKTIPKYKLEPVGKHVKYPKMEKYMRKEKYVLESQEWNITPDVEDNEFKPLINKIIDSNQSWLINGPPGAGKTFLINEIKKTLTEDNKIYKCLAPTNLAALLINGTTIHKFSCKLKKFKSFMEMKLDYLFVDEVSMLHSNFYKILMIIKKLKNCKLIISGDFNQLDVINDLQKYNYKDASILKELCDNNILKLTNCRRANSILFNLIQFENIPNLEK
jgi:5-methylcytosine-specific restriction endonuclease McrA